jgi:hypothetical protein
LNIDFFEGFPGRSGGFGPCRKVKDQLAVRSGSLQALVVKHIPANNLGTKVVERRRVLSRKGQGANATLLRSQPLYEVAADETRGTGYENIHLTPSFF